MRIALLGAESTGKTQLAAALAAHLARQGQRVCVVPEVLREWCDQTGRTPLEAEQDAIAREQARRSDAAAVGHAIVVADTTPMMIAVYSDYVFGDDSLYEFAWAHQRHYDLTLVTGLDLPWQADGLQRDGPHAREPVDALLRAALLRGGIGFQTIYGQGEARLQQVLAALPAPLRHSPGIAAQSPQSRHSRESGNPVQADMDSRLRGNDAMVGVASRLRGNDDAAGDARPWVWSCDKCSDPECEHRLFSALLTAPKR